MNRKVALFALIVTAAVGFLSLRDSAEPELSTQSSAQQPSPETRAALLRPAESGAGGHSQPATVESVDPGGTFDVDLSARYHNSSDYWQFVDATAAIAAAGDARAQFLIAKVLGECKTAIAGYERRYPGKSVAEIVEEGLWKSPTPALAPGYVEYLKRDFMKCAGFFSADPPALDALMIGLQAHTAEYWLALALANGDPIALIQDAYQSAAALEGSSADSRIAMLDRIETGVTLAVQSADPEALFRLGALVGFVGSTEPTEAPAWTIVACESGYDCSYANPAIGQGCASLGLCSGGESLLLNMQQDLGPLYGRAYARAQEILEHSVAARAISLPRRCWPGSISSDERHPIAPYSSLLCQRSRKAA